MSNKKPQFKIVDGSEISDPEVTAMLQAFYSRSPMPINERLADLTSDTGDATATEKIKRALKTYYVDYGHASIGECGFITVFIEGVSILAAKALQDTPLYVGQECSTRYLDFSRQPFYCPGDKPEIRAVQELLRSLYLRAMPAAKQYARTVYSANDVVSAKIPAEKVEASYEKTLAAIAFDYCRSVLPAGATTSLAWTGSFRSFNDHLRVLASNPLKEVRIVASALYAKLAARYPSSFKQELLPHDSKSTAYASQVFLAKEYPGYPKATVSNSWVPDPDFLEDAVLMRTNVGSTRKTRRQVTDNVQYFSIQGLLDYGSFRDLQRHRNGFNSLPALTADRGFSKYHMDAFIGMGEFDPFLPYYLVDTLQKVEALLPDETEDFSYAVPLGYQVPVNLHWSFGQLEYVARLRSSTSVHPTLREFIWSLEDSVQVHAPELSKFLSVNRDAHYTASDRGEQDIKKVL